MCSLQTVIHTTKKNQLEPTQIHGLVLIILAIRENSQSSTISPGLLWLDDPKQQIY